MSSARRLQVLLQHTVEVPVDLQPRLSNSSGSACSSAGCGPGPGPKLQVLPKSSLNDELLDISVSGLTPGQLVTLQAHVYTECGRYRFESSASYRADERGQVIVHRDSSLGGSYEGVEPMGLIWSLKAAPEIAHKKPRLVKRKVITPFVYTFELLDENKRVQQSTTVERWYLADYVERIPVTCGKAEGCLYLPNKKGHSDPLPVLLDIRGGVAFLVEDRPSLMASHGFAVFSINYFMKLMTGMTEGVMPYFDCQIFLDIFDFIANHPRLDSSRVGIVSSCLGSVLALHTVARVKELPIKCVAATGCLDVLQRHIDMKLPDGVLIESHKSEDREEIVADGSGDFTWRYKNDAFDGVEGDSVIPVEDILCPMVFFTLGDDQLIPSLKRMTVMKERIEKAGNGHLLEVVFLEGAGHYLDAPYLPLCQLSRIDLGFSDPIYGVCGGDPKLHAYAEKTAWAKTISFFRTHLAVRETYREDWLDTNSSEPVIQ